MIWEKKEENLGYSNVAITVVVYCNSTVAVREPSRQRVLPISCDPYNGCT